VHLAALLTGLWINFLQHPTQPYNTIADHHLESRDPARLHLQQHLAPALCRFPYAFLDRQKVLLPALVHTDDYHDPQPLVIGPKITVDAVRLHTPNGPDPAADGATVTRRLAREDSKVMGLFGLGTQVLLQVECHRVATDIEQARVTVLGRSVATGSQPN